MTPGTPNQTMDESSQGPPPVRTLAFTVLSLLVEAAAAHLGAGVPIVGEGERSEINGPCNPNEARLAIDGANALLSAVGSALASDERMAIEGLLTQLQVEYVKRSGA